MGNSFSISNKGAEKSLLLKQQRETVSNDFESNKSAVAVNASDQQTNVQSCQTNTQSQQSNSSDISVNNGNVQRTTGDIQTTAGNIQTTDQGISSANSQKSGVQSEIANMQSQLQSVQDDPERAASIQNDISAAEMSLAELDSEIQELEGKKSEFVTQKGQQEQALTGFEQKGTQLEETSSQLKAEGESLQQEGDALQQTGADLEQKGVDLESQISEFDAQISQAEAEEQQYMDNLEQINAVGEQISEEGGAVVTKQFASNTTPEQIAETQVSRYLDTMLNSDMFTSEEKAAFKDQLANALQDPKARKALQKGDMETVMKDPAVRAMINDKAGKINILNSNNPDAFKSGKVDVPLTSGEYDIGERKQQYTDFMYMMMHAADANTDYFKAGLKENSGLTDMYAPVLRGFNNEIVSDLEASNINMHNAMSDIVLKQDAGRFISALNQVNGNNFGVSKDDIAQLFQDYSTNPEDPSIKTRLLKYCGFEASANRLNNDLSSAQGAKRVCDFMVNAIMLKTPGIGMGEGIGLGAKSLFNVATKGSTSVKILNFSKGLGNAYVKIGKGLDGLNTANSFYDLFRSICPSNK